MADDTNKTDSGNIPKMDDTKTRKTLKLKPLVQKTEKKDLDPVVDPLTMRNTETGPLGTMDDTRTRKTVKLKATKHGVSIEDTPKVELKTVIDPLTIRNTETGPLGTMVDTRTRKTVKLKPLKSTGEIKSEAAAAVAGVAPPASAETAPAATPDEGAPKMLKDTNTRRTLKLKPVNPAATPPPATDADGAPKMLKDTNTRKTLKLKPINPADTPPPATNADGTPKMLKDNNTRKTLKLKPINPADAPPAPADGAPKMLKDTNTRKTLKLKPISPAEADQEKTQVLKKAPAKTSAAGPVLKKAPASVAPVLKKAPTPAAAPTPSKMEEDTRTKKVKAPSTNTAALSTKDLPGAEKPNVDDDTIKIERPKQKADAMPMPSLGATAEAKTVNNKETVKLRPPSTGKVKTGDEAAKASKETIKLSPPSAPETKEDKAAPSVNLKLDEKKEKKSKLTIGKAPPPKTPSKEEEAAPEEKAGGLKLKSMAPKTEAPRAAADKEKIKDIKSGKKGGKSQASPIYTVAAIITFVLVAFSALATTAQFFDLWDTKNPVGEQIVPHVKNIMDSLMKTLIK